MPDSMHAVPCTDATTPAVSSEMRVKLTRDVLEQALRREATQSDALVRAHRCVLARKDPIPCLRELVRLDERLLAEVRRHARSATHREAALVITVGLRGGRPAAAAVRIQSALLKARCATLRHLRFVEAEREALLNEALITLEAHAVPALRRIRELRRRIAASRVKAEAAEMMVAGHARVKHAHEGLARELRQEQGALLALERSLRSLSEVGLRTFRSSASKAAGRGLESLHSSARHAAARAGLPRLEAIVKAAGRAARGEVAIVDPPPTAEQGEAAAPPPPPAPTSHRCLRDLNSSEIAERRRLATAKANGLMRAGLSVAVARDQAARDARDAARDQLGLTQRLLVDLAGGDCEAGDPLGEPRRQGTCVVLEGACEGTCVVAGLEGATRATPALPSARLHATAGKGVGSDECECTALEGAGDCTRIPSGWEPNDWTPRTQTTCTASSSSTSPASLSSPVDARPPACDQTVGVHSGHSQGAGDLTAAELASAAAGVAAFNAAEPRRSPVNAPCEYDAPESPVRGIAAAMGPLLSQLAHSMAALDATRRSPPHLRPAAAAPNGAPLPVAAVRAAAPGAARTAARAAARVATNGAPEGVNAHEGARRARSAARRMSDSLRGLREGLPPRPASAMRRQPAQHRAPPGHHAAPQHAPPPPPPPPPSRPRAHELIHTHERIPEGAAHHPSCASQATLSRPAPPVARLSLLASSASSASSASVRPTRLAVHPRLARDATEPPPAAPVAGVQSQPLPAAPLAALAGAAGVHSQPTGVHSQLAREAPRPVLVPTALSRSTSDGSLLRPAMPPSSPASRRASQAYIPREAPGPSFRRTAANGGALEYTAAPAAPSMGRRMPHARRAEGGREAVLTPLALEPLVGLPRLATSASASTSAGSAPSAASAASASARPPFGAKTEIDRDCLSATGEQRTVQLAARIGRVGVLPDARDGGGLARCLAYDT